MKTLDGWFVVFNKLSILQCTVQLHEHVRFCAAKRAPALSAQRERGTLNVLHPA
jgi:hypothetical protein